MPASLKGTGGRLQRFARSSSDDAAFTTAAAPNGSANGTPANQSRSQPSRRELAEAARLPIPIPMRGAVIKELVNGSDQVEPASAIETISANILTVTQGTREVPHRDVFEGSHLGDDFLGSEPSIAGDDDDQPVMLDLTEEQTEVITEVPSPRKPTGHSRERDRGGSSVPGGGHMFQLGPDGRMSVVGRPAPHHDPAHMRDGFDHQRRHRPHQRISYNEPPRSGSRSRHRHEERPSSRSRDHYGDSASREIREVKIHAPRLPSHSSKPSGKPKTMQKGTSSRTTAPRAEEHHTARGERTERLGDRPRWEEPEEPPEFGPSEDELTPKQVRGKSKSPEAGPAQRVLFSSPGKSAVVSHWSTRTKKRRVPSLDYDDMTLSKMEFSELQHEPFDFNPGKGAGRNGHAKSSSDSLETRLEKLRQENVADQRQAFASMNMEEWEASGDWFVEQFADLMKKLRDARVRKRKTVASFEAEAAAREEAVRHSSDAIDVKLGKMKQDGMRVVAGRGGGNRGKSSS